MIEISRYKELWKIPLPTSPNTSYNTSINGDSFDIEFRVIGEKVLLTIKLGNKVLVNGAPIRWKMPMNMTSRHKYNKGEFLVDGEGAETYEHLMKGDFYFGSF